MKEVLNIEDENARMAAMQAEFQETIAKLREDLTARLRIEEAANKKMREEAAKREAANRESEAKLERLRKERSLGTSFDGQGGGNSADRRKTALSTMGPMWKRGVSTGGGLGRGLPYVPRDIVPKFPVECPPHEDVARERRFEAFIANQGLRHTISPAVSEIAVISCINDAYLFGHFGEALVTDHRRVWGYTSEATAGDPFEGRLYECHSVSDALRTVREWSLPVQPAERHLLVAELEGVQFMGDEDPTFFFARIPRLETTMRAVGMGKNESEIIQIILCQLPERYDVVKTMTLADPQLTRPKLENTIRSVYSQRKAHEIINNARRWVCRRNPPTVWYLAAVACLGSSSSCSNAGLPTVACRGNSSYSNIGLAMVASRGNRSSSNTGLAAAPMFSLRPGRRESSNRYSYRHGESLRSEVTWKTEVAPFLKLFSAVMAGLLRSGFSRKM